MKTLLTVLLLISSLAINAQYVTFAINTSLPDVEIELASPIYTDTVLVGFSNVTGIIVEQLSATEYIFKVPIDSYNVISFRKDNLLKEIYLRTGDVSHSKPLMTIGTDFETTDFLRLTYDFKTKLYDFIVVKI